MALELRNNNTELWLTAGSKIPFFDTDLDTIIVQEQPFKEYLILEEDMCILKENDTEERFAKFLNTDKLPIYIMNTSDIISNRNTNFELIGVYSAEYDGNVGVFVFVDEQNDRVINRAKSFNDFAEINITGSIPSGLQANANAGTITILNSWFGGEQSDEPARTYPNTLIEKLEYMKASKLNIKDAIIEKGGVVNDSTPLKDYAQAIKDLPSGGGLDLRHVSKVTGVISGASSSKVIPLTAICAEEYYTSSLKEKAVDGDFDTFWISRQTSTPSPKYIIFDFNEVLNDNSYLGLNFMWRQDTGYNIVDMFAISKEQALQISSSQDLLNSNYLILKSGICMTKDKMLYTAIDYEHTYSDLKNLLSTNNVCLGLMSDTSLGGRALGIYECFGLSKEKEEI